MIRPPLVKYVKKYNNNNFFVCADPSWILVIKSDLKECSSLKMMFEGAVKM